MHLILYLLLHIHSKKMKKTRKSSVRENEYTRKLCLIWKYLNISLQTYIKPTGPCFCCYLITCHVIDRIPYRTSSFDLTHRIPSHRSFEVRSYTSKCKVHTEVRSVRWNKWDKYYIYTVKLFRLFYRSELLLCTN